MGLPLRGKGGPVSFSGDVKRELSTISTADMISDGTARAELAGMLTASAVIRMKSDDKPVFLFRTETAVAAGRLYRFCRDLYGIKLRVHIDGHKQFGQRHAYCLHCDDPEKASVILKDTRILRMITAQREFDIPVVFLSKQRFLKSYLRGVFLACGSISDPNKTYRLEMAGRHRAFLFRVAERLKAYGIKSSVYDKKQLSILNIKESESIVTFLGLVGAPKALLKIENVRVIKSMRNGVNRRTNCDVANVEKLTAAAQRQIEDIQKLQKADALKDMPESVQALAKLRVLQPELSIKELGEMMEPKLGKSAVYYRLNQIKKRAQTL